MNTQFQRPMLLPTMANGALPLVAWPEGMMELTACRNRVGSRLIGEEEVFLFAGSALDFSDFLNRYASVQGVKNHRLILHSGRRGAGDSDGAGREAFDWSLRGRPAALHLESPQAATHAPTESSCRLEVHFWINGRIPLDQVVIPDNLEVVNDKLPSSK